MERSTEEQIEEATEKLLAKLKDETIEGLRSKGVDLTNHEEIFKEICKMEMPLKWPYCINSVGLIDSMMDYWTEPMCFSLNTDPTEKLTETARQEVLVKKTGK